VVANFLGIFAVLVFLALNGHLALIEAIITSFATVPIEPAASITSDLGRIPALGAQLFAIGLHLALPVLAAMLATNLALGVLTRSAPQLNLFSIGFPITLLVGLATLALALPAVTTALERYLAAGLTVLK
jgi:flagellar biosynthesis protein FliR